MDLPTKSYNLYGRELFERAASTSSSSSATATDSKGCVVCDSDTTCPTCDTGYQCVITVQSCSQCPKTYCKATSTTTSTSKTNIGGIIGGTLAGVVVLCVLLFLFYKYYYQRKVAFNRVRQHKEFFFDDDAEINFHHNREMEKPSQRTSIATTVFTRASNIIPIAYIPGVTTGPQGSSRNGMSSRISTVSEAGTVSSEFIGDRLSKASIVGNPALTTTAIRARPKLVTVTDVNPVGSSADQDPTPGTAVGVRQLGGVRSVQVGGRGKNQITLAEDLIEEEEEDDVQSVVMKEEADTVLTTNSDYEPFIIDDQSEDEDEDEDDHRSLASRESNGSVLLEVEIDNQSPFDDAFKEN